jgi:hypothetical protein
MEAAERGIPLSEPSTREFGVRGKHGGELRKAGNKGRVIREGVAKRRAPTGITHPTPRQVQYRRDENEDDGYGYSPFPRLKRRHVIDLGSLPPRPWEVGERVNTDRRERKKKGKDRGRAKGWFRWFRS